MVNGSLRLSLHLVSLLNSESERRLGIRPKISTYFLLSCFMSENLHLIIMVKSKKGFNWKARSQISGSVDLSQAKLLEDKLENNGKQKSRTGGGFEVGIAFRFMRRA